MPTKTVVFEVVNTADVIGPVDNRKAMHYRVAIQPHDPVTKCEIEIQYETILDSSWMFASMGIGVRKHGDAYDRDIGCRMALKSALRHIRDEWARVLIWEKYLELFPVSERVKPEQKQIRFHLVINDCIPFHHGFFHEAIKRLQETNTPF